MELDILKILKENLVDTGFREKYNSLVDRVIYKVEINASKDTLTFFTNQGTESIGLVSSIDQLADVTITNAQVGDSLVFNGTNFVNQIAYVEDNDYDSNFFIADDDAYRTAISKLDTALLDFSPVESMTGKDLILTGVTTYDAKLSAGLNAQWYEHPTLNSPGDTINSYITDNTYNLQTPDDVDANNLPKTFRAGLEVKPIGFVTHVIDNNDYNVAPMGSNGTQVVTDVIGTSSLTRSSNPYPPLWSQGTATVNFTQTREGYIKHSIKHTDDSLTNIYGGVSNEIEFWYDDVNSAPSFSASLSQQESSVVNKFLSGVSYYGRNTVIRVDYTAAVGIFRKCYHPTQVSRVEITGGSNVVVNPPTVPNTNSSFVVSNQLITLNQSNQSSGNSVGSVTARLYRPDGQTVSETVNLSKKVCTYTSVSTATRERFFDEDERVYIGTSNAFDSAASLPNGEAQVLNGLLVYGSSDYPFKTGNQSYERYFNVGVTSSGRLTFQGFNPNNIASHNTGSINMYLLLDDEDIYFDLGRPVGNNNGDGSGSSLANSKGCAVSNNSSYVNFSFGTSTTANNSNRFKIIIVFRSSTYSISDITVT